MKTIVYPLFAKLEFYVNCDIIYYDIVNLLYRLPDSTFFGVTYISHTTIKILGGISMKRMKTKIALTFVIVVIVGIIINGLIHVLTSQGNFITLDVIIRGIFCGIFYLSYIWSLTRRHPILTFTCIIIILAVLLLGIFLLIPTTFEVLKQTPVDYFESVLRDIASVIFYIVMYLIATYQAKKLIKEKNSYLEAKD